MKIRYAVIGTSWITECFINGCMIHNNLFELNAIYSRTFEKGSSFAEKFGCKKIITDLLALANDPEIDAVYIASPNALHYSQSKLMLEHSKHVICEKPITVTSDQLIELQALAKRNNVIYLEALMAMHLPERLIIKNALKSIGRISHARFDFSQLSSKYASFKKGEHQNIFDPKMATGALMDLGVYCVYASVFLFGEPKAYSYCCSKLSTGIDGEGCAILQYDNMFSTLTFSKTAQSALGCEIVGDKGTIVIPSISRLCDAYVIFSDQSVQKLTECLTKNEMMSYEALDFYRYITDFEGYKQQYQNDLDISITVNKILENMRRQVGLAF